MPSPIYIYGSGYHPGINADLNVVVFHMQYFYLHWCCVKLPFVSKFVGLYVIYFKGVIFNWDEKDSYFLNEFGLSPYSITFVSRAPNPSFLNVPEPQNFNSTFFDKVDNLSGKVLLVSW